MFSTIRWKTFAQMLCFMMLFLLTQVACASDDMGGAAAAAKAASGDASGRAGSVDSKVVGGYMPGDIYSPDVKAQRNTTASSSGPTYAQGSIAASSGAETLSKAVANDPIVVEIKAAIDAERALGEKASAEKLAALRAELVARVDSIAEQAGKAAPQITVSGNTMIVVAPSNTGAPPQPMSDADVKAAGEIQAILDALNRAKGPQPNGPPTLPEKPTTSPTIEPSERPNDGQ